MATNKGIVELKEFIENKFKSHEDLEALRFKRIDELITSFGKKSILTRKLLKEFILA